MAEEMITDLSRCGTPVALIAMGGLFKFSIIKKNLKALTAGVSFRLIVIPALMITASIAFGFRGKALTGLMCLFAAPCAVSSFNLAVIMDSDRDLTAQLVVFTSLFSLGTLFFWICLLRGAGFI